MFLGTAIAVILVVNQQVESTSNICDSPKCVQEAAKIRDYVDPNANPCEDFYQFACGNFLKNAVGDRELNVRLRMQRQHFRESVAMYEEDEHEKDHKMVKVAKKLYRGCMDEHNIQDQFAITIYDMFNKVGGWPISLNSSWDEEHFSWLNATYGLARFGYDSSAFLDLYMAYSDPDNDDKLILRIDVGARSDSINQTQLKELLRFLGQNDDDQILRDLIEMDKFWEDMRWFYFEFINNSPTHEKLAIEEIQKRAGAINWLEFITNLVGPKVPVTKDDYIMFPTKGYVNETLTFISRTSKRTLANYMMWRVVEPLLRFIPNDAVNPQTFEIAQDRSRFCMKEVRDILFTNVPDPMDVMWHRRYLSAEKKRKIENLVSKLKSEFAQALSKNEWIPEEDIRKLVGTVNKLEVMVGMPGNYFDDKMLDEADVVDMIYDEHDFFFALLGKVNRNRQSAVYARKDKLLSETAVKYSVVQDTVVPHYNRYLNLLYVPVSGSNDILFDENRPEYLNHGTLGIAVGFELSDILLAYLERREAPGNNSKDGVHCLEAHWITNRILRSTLRAMVGEEISYAVYEEWVKDNGEEPKLVATDYTPNQLFWISAVTLACEPIRPSKFSRVGDVESLRAAAIVSESTRHHPNFAKDFNCPANSRMNPLKKCKIL